VWRPLPPDAIELPELRGASIEHRLGYFADEPVVVFGYCPGGGEVIWKDGRSSGFGTGGWRAFLQEFAPLVTSRGASAGDLTSVGTHVLWMDRPRGTVYAVPRQSAEEFLARAYGLPPPTRLCLCAQMDCAACPFRTNCGAGPGGGMRPRTTAEPPSPDPVDEASIDSFPCSDPPGYGHA
jgi:hypothetical protein